MLSHSSIVVEQFKVPLARHTSRAHVVLDDIATNLAIFGDDHRSQYTRLGKGKVRPFFSLYGKAVGLEDADKGVPVNGR